jgi:prephenate dehydrogenase
LLEVGAVARVVGWDADPAALAGARERGFVHEVADAPEAAAGDVTVLAVPVRALRDLVARARGDVVTDVGSTKATIVAAGEAAHGGRFVGGHPLAGTEKAGPAAASAALFRGRRALLTPTAATDPRALATVAGLWRAAGADVMEMGAAEHDELMAAVSHLPHVVAYALADAVGALGAPAGMAGGGFIDTTRIASTPPGMWVDVFLDNRDAVLRATARFAERLEALRAAVEAGDEEAIRACIDAARAARARILG